MNIHDHNDAHNDERLDALSNKITEAEKTSASTGHSKKNILEQSEESKRSTGIAFRLGVELTSGIAVGCGLGLLIDHYFATSPWGLVVFFFLGSIAGFLNVYRAVNNMGYAVGYKEEKNDNTNDQ